MRNREGICEECGNYVYDLHIHHKDRNHSNNTPANLRRLCPYCHGYEHGAEHGQLASENKSYDLVDEISNKRVGARLRNNVWMHYNTTEEIPEFFD